LDLARQLDSRPSPQQLDGYFKSEALSRFNEEDAVEVVAESEAPLLDLGFTRSFPGPG